MAKAKTTPKKNGFNTQKIFKYVRIGALLLPAAEIAVAPGVTPMNKILRAKRAYFGVSPDGTFRWSDLAKGWTPYVASILVTYGIPKLASILRRL